MSTNKDIKLQKDKWQEEEKWVEKETIIEKIQQRQQNLQTTSMSRKQSEVVIRNKILSFVKEKFKKSFTFF